VKRVVRIRLDLLHDALHTLQHFRLCIVVDITLQQLDTSSL
jgi:hypothetical protein